MINEKYIFSIYFFTELWLYRIKKRLFSSCSKIIFIVFIIFPFRASSQINVTLSEQALSYYKLANQYAKQGEKIKAYQAYLSSNYYYKQLHDSAAIAENYVRIANIQKDLDDFNGAQLSAIESLEHTPNHYTHHLPSLYNVLAFSYKKLHNYSKAIDTYTKGLEVASNYQDSAILLNNMAITYFNQKKYDSALLLLSSIKMDKINRKEYARVLDNQAFIQFKKNQQNTLPQMLHALQIRDSLQDKLGQFASLIHLTQFYQNKNTQQAKQFAERALKKAKQLQKPDDELEALTYVIDLKENSKTEWTRFKFLNDSLITARNQAKNQFAYIQYESEKLEKENLKLKTETAEKKAEIEQGQKEKAGLLTLTFLLLLLGISLFIYFRNRHQREKERKVFETENRISKKVHDEVGNHLHVLMNKIQYQPSIAYSEIVDDLDDVYLKARDIAQENSSLNISFENCMNMLKSFNSDQTQILTLNFSKEVWNSFTKKGQAYTLYLVLQELMTNMKKYSHASFVKLRFEKTPKQWLIEYSDNGVSINFERMVKSGLNNVENRIESIHGRLIFDTSLTKGVFITLQIPK